MKNLTHFILISLLFIGACQSRKAKTEEAIESTYEEESKTKVDVEQAWATDTTMTTAESVLYDSANQVLYVSCINGVPSDAKDQDGFIAKVSPEDGSVIEQKWVTGLDAPKGLGLYEGILYVTNIDEIVKIDVASGEINGRVAVEGAKFLNDITVDYEGNVYFSDSNTNKIHMLSGDQVSVWVENDSLGGPNGLFYDGEKMMMATFGAGNFNEIDFTTQEVKPVVDSIPGGDGIVKVGVDFLVSNWNGEVYYVTSDYTSEKIIDTKEMNANAADIDFIPETNLLLVPTFFGNQVVAYKVTK